MVTAVLLLFLLYYLLMVFLLEGWRRAIQPGKMNAERLTVSVVVPFRNEARNCNTVLDSLAAQNYPNDKVDFILVDDHSSDGTGSLIIQWMASHPSGSFRLVSLAEGQEGKKAALTEAINQAKGEIIVTTDADCQFPPTWLQSITDTFTPETQVVVGPVSLDEKGDFFSTLQSMEFAALIGVGASTLAWGKPTMCNGANLAYRKRVFAEVNGFSGNEHITSGDDEFLLRKIFQLYPDGVRFNNTAEGIVRAAPAVSLRSFIQQRIRWAGKWSSHGIGVSSSMAVFIFLFYSSVIALLPLAMLNYISLQDTLLLLSGKLLFEGIWLYRLTSFLKIPFRFQSFFVLQIVYPMYVIFFALTANFLQAEWKGRKI
jgi:poly-beta-1,6-N-acetyl-D-glucosamine synthase